MSQLQGQDRNIICFAIFSFSMNHFILLVLDSAALSFRYILLEWCNCTMTGPIPLPHQSLRRRYGRPLNMTTPAPPPPRSVSTFMLMLINNRISVQLPSAEAWISWTASTGSGTTRVINRLETCLCGGGADLEKNFGNKKLTKNKVFSFKREGTRTEH